MRSMFTVLKVFFSCDFAPYVRSPHYGLIQLQRAARTPTCSTLEIQLFRFAWGIFPRYGCSSMLIRLRHTVQYCKWYNVNDRVVCETFFCRVFLYGVVLRHGCVATYRYSFIVRMVCRLTALCSKYRCTGPGSIRASSRTCHPTLAGRARTAPSSGHSVTGVPAATKTVRGVMLQKYSLRNGVRLVDGSGDGAARWGLSVAT